MFFEPDIFRLDADELFNKTVAHYNNVFFPTVRQDPAGDPYGVPIAENAGRARRFCRPAGGQERYAERRIAEALTPENWRLGTIDFLADPDGIGPPLLRLPGCLRLENPSLPHGWRRISAWPCRTSDPSCSAGLAAKPAARMCRIRICTSTSTARKRKRDPNEFKDKIVIIGVTASGCMTYDRRRWVVVRRY